MGVQMQVVNSGQFMRLEWETPEKPNRGVVVK